MSYDVSRISGSLTSGSGNSIIRDQTIVDDQDLTEGVVVVERTPHDREGCEFGSSSVLDFFPMIFPLSLLRP